MHQSPMWPVSCPSYPGVFWALQQGYQRSRGKRLKGCPRMVSRLRRAGISSGTHLETFARTPHGTSSGPASRTVRRYRPFGVLVHRLSARTLPSRRPLGHDSGGELSEGNLRATGRSTIEKTPQTPKVQDLVNALCEATERAGFDKARMGSILRRLYSRQKSCGFKDLAGYCSHTVSYCLAMQIEGTLRATLSSVMVSQIGARRNM